MKIWKLLILIATLGVIIYSCNSPMSVDTPREETPMGKVQAYLSEFTVEQYGKVYTFNANDYKVFINLYSEPNRLWLDLSLESFTNPVDELLRVAVKRINVHLDSIELKNGPFILKNEPDNKVDFEYFRWKDPDVIKTEFDEKNSKTGSTVEFKIDKINKSITIFFDIRIDDNVDRIETKYDDNGGISTFTSTETKTFNLKVNLKLKYI
jgi:hypothetical protein